ncbi:lysozyme inhibitor LprI family protein [Methylobacterium sp. Leaf361]|uniref:lysozyme inhibitor LprI family protein n=1 Tax=Methylobacterium sp. Leaf361 TaxID=1736352 RepID=UPI0009EA1486|nr:lysozyme inhibitor LprI family protein [Methylobacterium sp. Leaf361]
MWQLQQSQFVLRDRKFCTINTSQHYGPKSVVFCSITVRSGSSMSKAALRTLAGAFAGAVASVTFVPMALAAPSASAAETCDSDDPTSCLSRHGEAAGNMLSKAYADASKKVAPMCFEVIGPAIGDCLERARRVADKELDETYARAMKSIGSDDDAARKWRERLKLAQQAWLRFRDADCGDVISFEWMDGTGAGPAGSACLVAHTIERAAELKRRYDRE